jgi:2-keto-3-deoxy-L-rhamnonate aldolase RhmA
MFEYRRALKEKLRNRARLFSGWISYSHPSITETFAQAGFDMIFVDMEHSTISVEQGQRIIAASQYYSVPCLPRPVSHSNDYIKPLLESGADGLLIQMVETEKQVQTLVDNIKYPPLGKRTYGVNRAQSYGLDFDDYIEKWNESSIVLLQVESIEGVKNIEKLLKNDSVDGVMIGPLDIAGSLGVPGDVWHPSVIDATRKVIEACRNSGRSCGFQLADISHDHVERLFGLGYNFVILGSDLFVLTDWVRKMSSMIKEFK